jgi:hypothetical protein
MKIPYATTAKRFVNEPEKTKGSNIYPTWFFAASGIGKGAGGNHEP